MKHVTGDILVGFVTAFSRANILFLNFVQSFSPVEISNFDNCNETL